MPKEVFSPLAIECLVAVTGIYPSKPADRSDVEKARQIPGETVTAIRAFFDQKEKKNPQVAPKISYLGTWKRLNQKQDDREVSSLISDHVVADAYVAKLNEARDYLKGQWRPTKIATILGDKLLIPSVSEEGRCRDLFAMGNDPQRIVARLSACCMLAEELALVRAVFPEFYGIIGVYLDEEMFRRRALRKSYEVPYMQEVAIRGFTGDSLGAEAETINAESQAPEQEAPPEFDIQTKDRREGMTRADRVEEGNASG